VNKATGRCLDSDPSGTVYTLRCNGGSFQQWVPETTGSYDNLRNVATGRYLDGNHDGSVYTLPPNGGIFQKWFWVPTQ